MKFLLWAMLGGALSSGARPRINVGFGRWLGSALPGRASASTSWVEARWAAGLSLFGSVVPSIAVRYAGFGLTRWVVT